MLIFPVKYSKITEFINAMALMEKYLKKSVKGSSEKTKRDQHWRSSEEVELWILTNK